MDSILATRSFLGLRGQGPPPPSRARPCWGASRPHGVPPHTCFRPAAGGLEMDLVRRKTAVTIANAHRTALTYNGLLLALSGIPAIGWDKG